MKVPIFTDETIFKDSAEVPIDIDFNLPDYCPEISKILKCRAVARISSKSIGNRSVSVDGSVTVTVMYSDEDNMISSYEYQYPFSKTFETGMDLDGAYFSAKAKCDYINCRAITGRKIDIHGATGVYVCVTARNGKEALCDIDDQNTEVLRATVPATVPVCKAEKYLILEEEIEIGNSKPDIGCLIRYDTAVSVGECKLLAGKAIVKGDVAVSILYRAENGSLQSLKSTVPFSQLIEMEGVSEDCECETDAYVAYLEIKPKFSTSGEARSFLLDGKLLICAEGYCNNDVEVITDAYSRKYETQISSNEICFNKIVCVINDTFNCRKELKFPEGALSSVEDLWCEVKTDSVSFEGECLVVTGEVTSNIIACDPDGVPICYEKPIEFSYRYNLSRNTDDLKAYPKVGVLSSNYTISGDDCMEIRIEMQINAPVYECREMSVLSDVTINENKPSERRNNGSMTIYFADAGENIWDIARKYLADIGEVKRLNGVEEELLTQGKMILIPTN